MKKIMTGLIFAMWAMMAYAHEVQVNQVWTRATVAGQKSAGVFMEILVPRDAMLIKAYTPWAKKTELHEMKMEGDIMKMRPIKSIVLQANVPTVLKPGGVHVMILGLKKPLKIGDKLPLKLTFEFADKHKEEIVINADVVAQTAVGTQVAH
jgi:copper(I)-binding protein